MRCQFKKVGVDPETKWGIFDCTLPGCHHLGITSPHPPERIFANCKGGKWPSIYRNDRVQRPEFHCLFCGFSPPLRNDHFPFSCRCGLHYQHRTSDPTLERRTDYSVCAHRGEVLQTVPIANPRKCRASSYSIYSCEIHGGCTVTHQRAMLQFCPSCPDFSPAPLDTLSTNCYNS